MKNGPEIELFVSQTLQCGEGPVWDEARQCIYWTDSNGTEAYMANDHDRTPRPFLTGRHCASLTLHNDGGIMFCGKNGFHHLTVNGDYRSFASVCDDIEVTDINDIIADPRGRVLGGQEAFRENEIYKPGYLFQLDHFGKITILEEGLHLSNGMGFSPASDKFYLTDTILRTIYVYDYNTDTGKISKRRNLVTLKKNDGLPDGLTVDEEGFIWVACWFGNTISRFDPDGKLERTIELPVAQPSSVTFGGENYDQLFITSAALQWITPLAPDTHDFSSARGGALYRVRLNIRGKPPLKATI